MSARTSTEDKPSIQTKAPTTGAERPKCQTEEKKRIAVMNYHNDNNTARMPTHNHHLYLKRLLEFHNTEHDYTVLQVKQRMKEENEMLQNEMTRLREVRKITDWKITERMSRIWNRELMNTQSGWEVIQKMITKNLKY